ncbi:MAG: TonB-dependent receptor, partial [Bacteroidota bacterium]
FGLQRNIKNWKLDISNTTGSNDINFQVRNSNNASLGLTSPSSARAGGFSYTQNITNVDLTKKFPLKIPLGLGFGAEFRLENYRQNEGEESSWRDFDGNDPDSKEGGIQMFPGFRPEFATSNLRYNYGFYTNLEAELSSKFFLGTAARFEYYDDFGNNLSWNFYSRYKLTENIALKGSLNSGFRAPSMPQTFFNNFTFQVFSTPNGPVGATVGQFNNESVTARLFGFESLKAETSLNLNLGFAAKITDELSVSAEAYRVDIKDRIVLSSRLSVFDDPRFQTILEPFDVLLAQFFTNAIDTKTEGLDFAIHYKTRINNLGINLSLMGNFGRTEVLKDDEGNINIKTSAALENIKDKLFNREEISRLESIQPSSKIIFNSNFRIRKFNLNLRMTRFGSVNYLHPEDGNPSNWVTNSFTGQIESRDQTFTSKIITDLDLTFDLSNNLTFSLGAQNLLNVYPDEHEHSANTSNGIFTYSRRVQQFGIRGAYFYGGIGVKL